jgi:hypothetical protein
LHELTVRYKAELADAGTGAGPRAPGLRGRDAGHSHSRPGGAGADRLRGLAAGS